MSVNRFTSFFKKLFKLIYIFSKLLDFRPKAFNTIMWIYVFSFHFRLAFATQ